MLNSNPVLLPQPRNCVLAPTEDRVKIAGISESIDSGMASPQSYRIRIDLIGQVHLTARDSAGLFYARQTLAQLRRQFADDRVPPLKIEDSPDFPVRGVMLDISRDKVPTMATLFSLIDRLAEWKINQVQLYTEHTFAFRDHETVWIDASPITGQEIRELDAYCRERFIELVPNQNSFGHLERWFKHPRYQHLAEQPDGFVFPWGNRMPTGFSLNPTDPASLRFVESLFDELLPNFSSKLFNVGCDETFDVGLGRSKAAVEQRGRERVYLEFVQNIHRAVTQRGRQMMFWGDIILHKPELLDELPKDLIALNWGYEADHPFEIETKAFAKAGIPFYVCPGTSSWCSLSGRSDNAIANLQNSAKFGLANRAAGYLITDWGDHGHLQYLPTSYLPLAAGAAYAWCGESNRDLPPLLRAIDIHVFQDDAQMMARLMYDFGNVGLALKNPIKNGSALFWALINGKDRRKNYENVSPEEYRAAEDDVERAIANLDRAKMRLTDRELIREEIRNTAAMLKHACRRGIYLKEPSASIAGELQHDLTRIIAEHERLWLSRNRQGGLIDSAQKLRRVRDSYTDRNVAAEIL